MVTKKKAGKKGKGKKKKKTRGPSSPTVPAGLVEALEARLRSVTAELESERQQKMYFQMERDKISTAYEACRKELEAKNMELRNKQRDMEFLEKRHQEEIKQFKEKIQMLQFEHTNSINSLKSYSEKSINMLTEQFKTREAELKEDRRTLEQRIRDMEISHEHSVAKIKQEHDKELEKLRREFEEPVLLGVFRGSGGGGPGCWEFMRRKSSLDGDEMPRTKMKAVLLPPQPNRPRPTTALVEADDLVFETRVLPRNKRPDSPDVSANQMPAVVNHGPSLTYRPGSRGALVSGDQSGRTVMSKAPEANRLRPTSAPITTRSL